MPQADQYEAENCRLMVYGIPKTGKTAWAIKAAVMSGYKVIVLNGDNGLSNWMMKDFTPEQKQQVYIFNCADKGMHTNFCAILGMIAKKEMILWDDTVGHFSFPFLVNPEHAYMTLNPALLHRGWVIIVDTYTKLVQSTTMRHALDNNIDLSAAEKTDWDGFGMQGRYLDFILQKQGEFECHWITICHAEDHVRRESKRNANGKWESREIPQGTWPKSCSRPHSKTIGAQFTDLLYSFIDGANDYWLDTRNLPDRQGGVRNLAPGQYKMDQLVLEHLTGYRGENIRHNHESAVVYYPPGTYKIQEAAPTLVQPTADQQQVPIVVPQVKV